jgi:site-specific DNA-methyltransferase (adenine-specific)
MTTVTLHLGDCLDYMRSMPAGSVDLIVTDPPYPKEFEHLYGAMAKEAKRVLRRGGSLVTLCGHYQLARILPDMAQHLKYRWIIKYDQPGSYARMAMGILVTWKPMLWFVNEALSPSRNVTDYAISSKRSKASGHPWEQDLDYALWAIENLTDEGDTVLDPFLGSGTTAIACKQTNRNFIGCEIDAGYFAIAERRIADAQTQLRLIT